MKSMLMHSFVLDALEHTGADTFSHFEVLIEEHRQNVNDSRPSRLKQLVPTVGTFHTPLPLRAAFELYNAKHRLTKRKHIQISFNEIRHIMNLAQVMAMRSPETRASKRFMADQQAYASNSESADFDIADDTEGNNGDGDNKHHIDLPEGFNGAELITFDGDQTLYSDGANFEGNPRLATYLMQLLKHGVTVAVVTAAGYEYQVEKYELRLSGLLDYFKRMELTKEECSRFYLFGGECNYLLQLGSDYRLHAVSESGAGGWLTTTRYLPQAPGNWKEDDIKSLLDVVEASVKRSLDDQGLRGRVIRKKRAVGLVPLPGQSMSREALDETVLRCQTELERMNDGKGPDLPYCAFNGGSDAWVDMGNKRVGVEILQSYLGIDATKTLHIGDQFLNTGNDYAARDVCPCIWITSPEETTYILKTMLRMSGIATTQTVPTIKEDSSDAPKVDFKEIERRSEAIQKMDVYTGEITTAK